MQIDLLIDRRDDIVNLCVMKYTNDIFVINAKYARNLVAKAEVFRNKKAPKKVVYLTLVTVSELLKNEHLDTVQNVIARDNLFCLML